MKSNNTVETNEYASTFLAYFKKGLHMATETPNEMQRHNGKLKKFQVNGANILKYHPS